MHSGIFHPIHSCIKPLIKKIRLVSINTKGSKLLISFFMFPSNNGLTCDMVIAIITKALKAKVVRHAHFCKCF